MSEKYNLTCERLWELLEAQRPKWKTEGVDLKQPFPADQFAAANPSFMPLVEQVQNEFKYEMSEFQCSWAVVSYMHDSWEDYKRRHKLTEAAQ